MKKVFACLSALVLMLVAFGLFAKPVMVSAVEVAEGKFIEDPTLEEGDIPIYVMNSIRTTFPTLYDYNAQKDENYGIGRDYYWNEIKLVVPRFTAEGPTGEQYTVYTQGSYSESTKNAAATKIYVWGLDGGEVKTGTITGSSASYTGMYPPLFGDVSLSGVRYNISGQEVEINNIYYENGVVNGDGSTDCFYVIFDGQGKAVRGAAHDNYFAAEKVEQYGFNPIFGVKDGKIVVREDIVGGAAVNGFGAADAELDKEQIAVPNPDDPVLDPVTGEPMYDETTGEPLYNTMNIDGENPAISMGTRYVWQWYSEEDFDAESVNKVQYMQEGWLANLWDYAYADPNGGYVCVAFAPALAKFAKTSDAQAAIHNASVRALEAAGELDAEAAAALLVPETSTVDAETGEETITYTHIYREKIIKLTIPVDGISYRYGYLDYAGMAVESMHFEKFCPLWESALFYGRHEDYQAYARTYNFTATGLQTQNAVVEGQGYIVKEEGGKLVVEIKDGAVIKPSELIKIQGMLGGYGVAGKPSKEAGSNVAAVTSYKQADVSELSYIMDINGKHIMWAKRYKYESFDAAVADFVQALAAWKGISGVTTVTFADNTYGKFADGDWELFKTEVPEWNWFANYYEEKFNAQAAADGFTGYTLAQANGIRWGMHGFANKTKVGSWPYSPDFSKTDFEDFWDICPEPDPFLYESMDEMLAALLEALEAWKTAQGKPLGSAEDPVTWATFADKTYGKFADGDLELFSQENPDWSWFASWYRGVFSAQAAIDEFTGYTADQANGFRWGLFAFANKIKAGSWPYSPDFANRSDEAYFIGINEVMPTWAEAKYTVPSTVEFMDTFPLTLEVTNKATGVADTMEITFIKVNEFTPVIKVDESQLKVKVTELDNGKKVNSIDLSKVFSAWDCVYKESGNGVFGSDISRQYLQIVTPEGFDANNIAAGTYKIKAVATCPNQPNIQTEAEVTLTVLDTTAPQIKLRGSVIYVQAGAQLLPADVLDYAVDDLEGDYLASASTTWYNIKTDYSPEDAEIGDEYSSQIIVMDSNGNSSSAKFTVVVTGVEAEEPDFSGLEEQIAELKEAIQALQKAQEEAQKAQAEKEAQEKAEKEAAANAKGCKGKKAGAYVASAVAGFALVAILLKKRH